MAVNGRSKYPTDRFRFGTDTTGRPVAYVPDQLLVKTPSQESDRDEFAQALNEGLVQSGFTIHSGKNRQPGFRLSDTELPNDWRILEFDELLGVDLIEVLARLRQELPGIEIQLNHLYFMDSIGAGSSFAPNQFAPNQFAPNQFAPNQFAPNQFAPNQFAPNQFAPNQFAPNQFAPNQFAPNQFAPNQFAPNQFAPMMFGRGSDCCTCPTPPGDENEAPFIAELTARRAYGPPPVANATGKKADLPSHDDLEIHVLDVRRVLQKVAPQLNAAKGIYEKVNAPLTAEEQANLDRIEEIPGAIIARAQEAKRVAREPKGPEKDAIWADFTAEPASSGLGTNSNNDSYVDPVCGHTEFITGIIGRIVKSKMITTHAIAGTLGDVSDTDLAVALEYVHLKHGPANDEQRRILSLSLSGYNDDDETSAAPLLAGQIQKMVDAGWLVVASAGNNASCRLAWPAALPGVVAVGAYGQSGPGWFSNYGPWVDACAPGVHVVSDYPRLDTLGVTDQGGDELIVNGATTAAHFDTGYAAWSGTSFSAPFVAAQLAAWMITQGQGGGMATVDDALDGVIRDPDLARLPGLGTVVEYRGEING